MKTRCVSRYFMSPSSHKQVSTILSIPFVNYLVVLISPCPEIQCKTGTCILMLFIPIKHYSLLLIIFMFTLTLFIVHNKPKCEFFPELCQKKKHYESILNIENHDEVMTVNTGDSRTRTEGANEIISF